MNYSRIVLFSVGIYLLLVTASAIATMVVGSDEAIQSTAFIVTLHFLGFVLSLLMYLYLAYKQAFKPYQHAVYVAILYWLISFGGSLLIDIFLEVPFEPLVFLFPILLNVIAVLLGTLLGIQLRQKIGIGVNAI